MSQPNTLTFMAVGQSEIELHMEELPAMDAERVTRYIPVQGAPPEPKTVPAFDLATLPLLNKVPSVVDVGYLATEYATQQFRERINPPFQLPNHTLRRQRRRLGALILSRLPGVIQDDLTSAARQISYYRSQPEAVLRDIYLDTRHIRRKLVAYEIRSTGRSILYHMLEQSLIRLSTAEHTVRRRVRRNIASLLNRELPARYREPVDEYRNWVYPNKSSTPARLSPLNSKAKPATSSVPVREIPDQPTIQFAAAMTLGPASESGTPRNSPAPRTLRAAFPDIASTTGRLTAIRAPTTTPLVQTQAPKQPTTDVSAQLPAAPSQRRTSKVSPYKPWTWLQRAGAGIADAYYAFQNYGRELSTGLYPPPAVFWGPATLSPARISRPYAYPRDIGDKHLPAQPSAGIDTTISHGRKRSQGPVIRNTRYAAPTTTRTRSLRYGTYSSARPAGVMWYKRFEYLGSDGKTYTQIIPGTGAELDTRVWNWNRIHIHTRLIDEGPLKNL